MMLVIKPRGIPAAKPIPLGFTLDGPTGARVLGRAVLRVYVTRALLHVLVEADVVDAPDVLLCRFDADESPAVPREAWFCTLDMLAKIVDQVDAGRAKAVAGEVPWSKVEEMEERAQAVVDAMERPGVQRVFRFEEEAA